MPRPVSWCCEICGETFAAYEEAVACERTPPPPEWPPGTVLRSRDARLWLVVPRPESWTRVAVYGHHREHAIMPTAADGTPEPHRAEPFEGGIPWLWVSAADTPMEVVALGTDPVQCAEPSCPT